MNNLVEINNITLEVKEFKNQRVVTFRDIDRVHKRPDGTARKAFNRNKKRLIENEDYIVLKPNVHETDISNILIPNRGITVLTESGYLLLVKVFDDNLAWEVQRQLVSNYFQVKEIYAKENSMENKLIELLSSMNDRLLKLEENQEKEQIQTIETTYKKPYNPWFAKMQPKYKLLEEYFDITRGQLYKNIIWELENLYDIDTQQIQADYCYENNISSCYPLEPYEFVPKYRDMIEQIVNSNLIKYGIVSESDPIASTKHITIFDTPVKV